MSYDKMSYEANKVSLAGKEPVAEVKTTVYADKNTSAGSIGGILGSTGTQKTGAAYAADLVDRTEGNNNWSETGGERLDQQDLKDLANKTASAANYQAPVSRATTEVKASATSAAANANVKAQQGKEALSHAVEVGKEKLHQATATAGHNVEVGKEKLSHNVEVGKEKLSHNAEVGKEKLGETYNAAGQRLTEAKDYTVESSQSAMEKLRETAGQTATTIQTKTHEFVETAQHTLEQAREKAREVFTGAGQKLDEAQSKLHTTNVTGPTATTYQAGDATEIKVKATENPSGGIDKIKVEAKATNVQ